jgi:hypothetical protein
MTTGRTTLVNISERQLFTGDLGEVPTLCVGRSGLQAPDDTINVVAVGDHIRQAVASRSPASYSRAPGRQQPPWGRGDGHEHDPGQAGPIRDRARSATTWMPTGRGSSGRANSQSSSGTSRSARVFMTLDHHSPDRSSKRRPSCRRAAGRIGATEVNTGSKRYVGSTPCGPFRRNRQQ